MSFLVKIEEMMVFVRADCEILPVEVRVPDFEVVDHDNELLLVGGVIHFRGKAFLVGEGDGVFAGWGLRVGRGFLDGGSCGGVTRKMLGQDGSNGKVGGFSGDVEMAGTVGDLDDGGGGNELFDGVEGVLAAVVPSEGFILAEFLLSEDTEYLAEMLKVGLEGEAIDKDIIEVKVDTDFEEVVENVVHGGLECGGGVGEAIINMHNFPSFSKKDLDLEAKIGHGRNPTTDGRKKSLPTNWKAKGRIMFVDNDGSTIELDDEFQAGEGSEAGSVEASGGGIVASVAQKDTVIEADRPRRKRGGGASRSQGLGGLAGPSPSVLLPAPASGPTGGTKTAMRILESYVLLGGAEFLQQHAQTVVRILDSVVGNVKEKGMVVTLPLIDLMIQCFPAESPPLLEPVLKKLMMIVVRGQGESDMIRAQAATVLARVLLQNSTYFGQLLSNDTLVSALQQQQNVSTGSSSGGPLVLFLDAWLDKIDLLTATAKRKLSAMALCILLTLRDQHILERLEQILRLYPT
ncbi:hypothetical protein CBR_g44565 [Chara braunii]|uniref:Importin-7/11-like TPR repeats domain-containing protein n=1 Tax=Chara braunii TaxID=69332 RepID=A0A388LY19_CHABU|nr:hypothetical protein CBR_g44565 [Chara braunii]|eukprot:GBG87109.1 hypothetical protein CBR_g44565 [Chara braunii]